MKFNKIIAKIKFINKAKKIKLSIIPAPAEGTRAVIDFQRGATIQGKGIGFTTLICGKYDRAIAENIEDEMIRNIVMRCGNCRTYNEVPMYWKQFHLVGIEEKLSWPFFILGIFLIIVSQFINYELIEKYGEIVRWTGIIIATVGAVAFMHSKKIIQNFIESD